MIIKINVKILSKNFRLLYMACITMLVTYLHFKFTFLKGPLHNYGLSITICG